MANVIPITDVTKLAFNFQTTKGSVIISYPGVTSVTVSGLRQWYTYSSGGNMYFVDEGPVGTASTAVASFANNTDLAISVGTSGGNVILIGNGDCAPVGGVNNFYSNITNDNSTPTSYVIVNITTSLFVVKHNP